MRGGGLGVALLVCACACACAAAGADHSSNWAVIVSASRFWYNYRHVANALSIYHAVRRLGMPDSHIVLMVADDFGCNPRNLYPGTIFNSPRKSLNLYGGDIEIDYRGDEVTSENLVRVLTGRHHPAVPRSKRLLSGAGSNVLVYLSGHGGKGFLKFQDSTEISSQELADSFGQMHDKQRYNELLFMVDTCHAEGLLLPLHSPGIVAIGSSALEEDSYSRSWSSEIGVALSDAFTEDVLTMLSNLSVDSPLTLADMFASLRFERLHSHPMVSTAHYHRPLSQVRVTEFFASTGTSAWSREAARGPVAPIHPAVHSASSPTRPSEAVFSRARAAASGSMGQHRSPADEERRLRQPVDSAAVVVCLGLAVAACLLLDALMVTWLPPRGHIKAE